MLTTVQREPTGEERVPVRPSIFRKEIRRKVLCVDMRDAGAISDLQNNLLQVLAAVKDCMLELLHGQRKSRCTCPSFKGSESQNLLVLWAFGWTEKFKKLLRR